MFVTIILLILTYIFGGLLQTGFSTLGMIPYQHDWDESRKKHAIGRANKMVWFSLIAIIFIGYLGWYYTGSGFFTWFFIVLVFTYIQGKFWSRKR